MTRPVRGRGKAPTGPSFSPPATPLKGLSLTEDDDNHQGAGAATTPSAVRKGLSRRVLLPPPSSSSQEPDTKQQQQPRNNLSPVIDREEQEEQQEQQEGPAVKPQPRGDADATLEARLQKIRPHAFVLRLETTDKEEARRAVLYARARGQPLLLQGLLAAEVRGFTQDRLLLLPEDVKVVSDDKTGIGFQPLRDWGQPPKRRAGVRADHPNWGRIASIMSEKGPQARLWARFMEEDMAGFRAETGHTALAAFGESVFGAGVAPKSSNVIVTGNAHPTAEGRQYELKSDAHQDQHDNLMLVTSGSKVWALAALTEAQVAKGRKRKGKLSSSFALDAVDRTRNKTAEEHEVAAAFETVFMQPGDVLFNPAYVWHQVNSEPRTLAYSCMYAIAGPAAAEGACCGQEAEVAAKSEGETAMEGGGSRLGSPKKQRACK